MKIAVRIPEEPQCLEQYLEILTGAHIADAVELDGQTVDQGRGWEELLDAHQLTLLSVSGLLPESVSRYIPETDPEYRRKLSEYCKGILKRAAASGALFASFELGVDRAKSREEDFDVRVKLVRSLMQLAEGHEMTIGIPMRVPASQPGSTGQQTVQLVNEVMHPCCRLILDVFPEELGKDFDVKAFMRQHHFNVAGVRFHYEPALGIRLNLTVQQQWSSVLKWHGFKGLVAFCPAAPNLDLFKAECLRLRKYVLNLWSERSEVD